MVKVALTPLSESEFIFLLNKHNHVNYLRGGSLRDINIFRSRKRIQRGYGIFSIIANLGRRALPYLSKYVFPIAKEIGKGVITDMIDGQSLKSSFKKRGKDGLKTLGERIVSGKGKKRKNKIKMRKKKKSRSKRGSGNKKLKIRKRKKQVKSGKGKKQKVRKKKIVKKKKRRSCHSYMTDIFSN